MNQGKTATVLIFILILLAAVKIPGLMEEQGSRVNISLNDSEETNYSQYVDEEDMLGRDNSPGIHGAINTNLTPPQKDSSR